MSIRRNLHLTRRSAAQLLDGSPGDGTHGVAQLLSAARAASHQTELAGESTALAMFRAATLAPTPVPRRPPMIKTTIAKLLAAKLLTASAVAAAAGGVALAAVTGALPNPLGQTHSSAAPAPAHTSSQSVPTAPDRSSDQATEPASTSTTGAARPSATPTPSLMGLCRAYQAGATRNSGNALNSPAFTALVTAAGGVQKLDSYCTTLIGAPATHPTGAPATHPSGAPATHPTHPTPPTHPTRPPATLPSQQR